MRDVRFSLLVAVVVGLLVAPVGLAEMVRYDGHRVVSVQVQTEAELELLLSLTDDVWEEGVGLGELRVRVSPEQFEMLKASGLPYTVWIEDIQPLIDEQLASPGGARATWDHYMPLTELLAYMNSLVALRPDLAQTFNAGKTIEGRDMIGLRITKGTSPKPGVLYHGDIHAREWITVPVALYVADQLVRNYDTDPYIRELVDGIEWFIIPVLNVDGYVYTWDKDRMWRKNRRDNPGTSCDGVDLNRNLSVGWGGSGSSGDPCSEVYRGASAFSEPETQNLRNFVMSHTNLVAYNDLHSYGQLIMYPYGYKSAPPTEPDLTEYKYLAKTQADLLKAVHGTVFAYGSLYTTIYPASGVTVDWVYDVGYAPHKTFAFTYELRDKGSYGFLLPPSQIMPSIEETLPPLLFYADARSSSYFAVGDLNCDGTIDTFDIDAFVLALTNPSGYDLKYPECDRMLADCNGDGKVNAFDIDPFVDLLTGP